MTTNAYDLDGRASTSTTRRDGINIESVTNFGHSTYGSGWSIGYDNAGTLRGYTVEYHNPSNGNLQYTVTYKNSYKFGENYLDTQQSVNRSDNSSVTNYFTKVYNANGELISTADSEKVDRTRYYANNQSGQALTVINGDFSSRGVSNAWDAAIVRGNYGGYGDNSSKSQYFFFANGNLIGTFGQLQKNGVFAANFDTNYTPITDSYPASVPSTVIAEAGETLRSIAARVFGDANLWYILADENGLTNPDEDLPDGMQLRVPNDVISLHNTADSFKPYNSADAIGDTTPTSPPPPTPKGCGVVGMIIMIVVMVVATIFTAGAAAYGFAAMMGTTITTAGGIMGAGLAALGGTLAIGGAAAVGVGFAAAVVGGALGSAISQGVGIAIGAQDKFDWKGVAMGALSAGIGSGLGAAAQAAAKAVEVGGKITTLAKIGSALDKIGAVGRAAVSSAATQGIAVATGLQSSFSWKQVAIAAIAAPLQDAVGGFVGKQAGKAFGDGFGKFAGDFAGNAAVGYLNKALGGKVDSRTILADAFGNALGNEIVGMMVDTQPAEEAAGPKRNFWERNFGVLGARSKNPQTTPALTLEPPSPDEVRKNTPVVTGTDSTGAAGAASAANAVTTEAAASGAVAASNTAADEALEEIVVTGIRGSVPDINPAVGMMGTPVFSWMQDFMRWATFQDAQEIPASEAFDSAAAMFKDPMYGAAQGTPVPKFSEGRFIPEGAIPMSKDDVAHGMSWLGKAAGWTPWADNPDEIYSMYSLPMGSEYEPLREMLNSSMQLKDGVTKADFYRKAQDMGLRMILQENGIKNSYLQGVANGTLIATELAAAGTPALVLNVYNPTVGGISDSAETFFEGKGMNTAGVSATRIDVREAMAYNAALAEKIGAPVNTMVWGHSQGTAVVNEAVMGLKPAERNQIELYNFGTATGRVPGGLAKYRSIENMLDPVPVFVSEIGGAGGVENSRGFLNGVRSGRDYEAVHVRFDAVGTHANHSLPYYFQSYAARAGLGFVPLTPAIQEHYRYAPWFKGQ